MATQDKKPDAGPNLSAAGLRFAIITSRYNDDITRPMHDAAKAALIKHGATEIAEHWIPGGWELPYAALLLAKSANFDAIIALGCVIRGETTHHEHIGREASAGLMRVSLDFNIPFGFGLLTTDTHEQARERAGGKHCNKGEDAALATIEMAMLRAKHGTREVRPRREGPRRKGTGRGKRR